MFLVLVFAFASAVLNRDADSLLIQPLNRINGLVRQMQGSVFQLSNEKLDQEQIIYETEVIEKAVRSMADTWDECMRKSKEDGGLSCLRRYKKVQPSSEVEASEQGSNSFVDRTESLKDDHEYLFQEEGFETFLENKACVKYFQAFLTQELSQENLLFY